MKNNQLYKIDEKKLNKRETFETMHDSLTFLIESNNIFLENMKDVTEDIEDIKYTTPFADKIIGLLNKNWDKKIEKEKEKCKQEIMSNKLKNIVKDVNKSLKMQPQAMESIHDLAKQAASSDDERYSLELLKFIQKMLKDSNEIFEYQLAYSDKLMEAFPEEE